MKKILLTLLLICSLSAYSIPTYFTSTIIDRDIDKVMGTWATEKIRWTEKGWILHSTNLAIQNQTQYLTNYHYWLVWECKDGTCEVPK
tara:strand:- start:52 stop:315 length:264 start_codon:yes stop_codon:yes gene_type:complete